MSGISVAKLFSYVTIEKSKLALPVGSFLRENTDLTTHQDASTSDSIAVIRPLALCSRGVFRLMVASL